jgi:hypothetical protein
MVSRRFFLGGLLAAPAIVRASSLDGLALLRPAADRALLDYDEFAQAMLRQIAAAYRLPYEMIARDYENVSYSRQ